MATRPAMTARVQVALSMTIGGGASKPAWTQDGTPAPLASIARS